VKSISVSVPELLAKVISIAGDKMSYVTITLNDEEIDQGEKYPPFAHFEAMSEEGMTVDYESIDSLDFTWNA
jgi:hypothetical protein